MSDADLDRVRRDLETMKEAAGTELPFGRADVKRDVLQGLLAVPLALWSTVGPGTHMSLAIILTLIALVVPGLTWGVKHRHQRFQRPSRWREYRYEILLPLVAAPFLVFFACWAIANGTPPMTMVGLVLIAAGIGACLIALFSQRRRTWGGMGVAMMACGVVMPWCTEQQTGLAMALLFIVGGSATAAIGAWQLRRNEGNHGTD